MILGRSTSQAYRGFYKSTDGGSSFVELEVPQTTVTDVTDPTLKATLDGTDPINNDS